MMIASSLNLRQPKDDARVVPDHEQRKINGDFTAVQRVVKIKYYHIQNSPRSSAGGIMITARTEHRAHCQLCRGYPA